MKERYCGILGRLEILIGLKGFFLFRILYVFKWFNGVGYYYVCYFWDWGMCIFYTLFLILLLGFIF